MKNKNAAVPRDDRSLHFEESGKEGYLAVVQSNSGRIERVEIAYPRAGYGGHELVVSPKGRYLVLGAKRATA